MSTGDRDAAASSGFEETRTADASFFSHHSNDHVNSEVADGEGTRCAQDELCQKGTGNANNY